MPVCVSACTSLTLSVHLLTLDADVTLSPLLPPSLSPPPPPLTPGLTVRTSTIPTTHSECPFPFTRFSIFICLAFNRDDCLMIDSSVVANMDLFFESASVSVLFLGPVLSLSSLLILAIESAALNLILTSTFFSTTKRKSNIGSLLYAARRGEIR